MFRGVAADCSNGKAGREAPGTPALCKKTDPAKNRHHESRDDNTARAQAHEQDLNYPHNGRRRLEEGQSGIHDGTCEAGNAPGLTAPDPRRAPAPAQAAGRQRRRRRRFRGRAAPAAARAAVCGRPCTGIVLCAANKPQKRCVQVSGTVPRPPTNASQKRDTTSSTRSSSPTPRTASPASAWSSRSVRPRWRTGC